MSTTTVCCPCGQRVHERVDFISPAYVITFADAATGELLIACPACNRPLYESMRDGELRRAP